VSSSISSFKWFFFGFALVFTIGSLLFIIGSEFIVRTHVEPRDDYEDKRRQLHTLSVPFAAFADSRGADGLIAGDKFANFSMRGENIITILEKAKFFAHARRPAGIILQADAHHFASYRLVSDQAALRDDLFMRSSPWLQFLRPVYRQYLLEYWQASFNNVFAGTSEDTADDARHTTARLTGKAVAEVNNTASIRVQLQTPIMAFANTDFAAQYEQAIEDMQHSGITVCLVTFPVSQPYRQMAATQSSFDQVLRYYEALATKLGVTHLNLWGALNDGMFSDPDHLNKEGAAALTKIVLEGCFGLVR